MLMVLHVWGMVKSAISVIIGNDKNSDHEITCQPSICRDNLAPSA